MDPSVIFAIIAGVIIVLGRAINRRAEAANDDTPDTTQSFDAEHEFDGEEAIPARQTRDFDDLADTILAQIMRERKRVEMTQTTTTTPQSVHAPLFRSNATSIPVTPKPKNRTQPKAANKPVATTPSQTTTPSNETKLLDDEFDLRKAIIYAEILNVKFDE